MDGWETRRKRLAGHDWCIISLGSGLVDSNDAGSGLVMDRSFAIRRIELDTAYFTGNQTPRVSIEALRITRPIINDHNNDHDNEDYLYGWMPGASTRLARSGGRGIRGTGQSPTAVQRALDACKSVARKSIPNNLNGDWITILPMTPLQPGYEESRFHHFEIMEDVKSQIESLGGVTHLKLNYYPDGGVARIKVFGYPCSNSFERSESAGVSPRNSNSKSNTRHVIHPHSSPNPPPSTLPHPYPELSSELHGGLGLACSNKHYGVPSNLLRSYPGKDMGDGWETARHPDRPAIVSKDPVTGLQDTLLKDWSVLKLGFNGGAKVNEGVSRIIVDTRHFKGNFPESVTIDACYAEPGAVTDEEVCDSAGEDLKDGTKKDKGSNLEWFPLLKRTPLTADAEHEFTREQNQIENAQCGVTHVRVSITPDGGLSRVRIYGSPSGESEENLPRSHL